MAEAADGIERVIHLLFIVEATGIMVRSIVLLGCSGSGKSLVARFLRYSVGTLVADESVVPTCIAQLVNQGIGPLHTRGLALGVAEHLRVFQTSGQIQSRGSSCMHFLQGLLTWAELRNHLCNGKRDFARFVFESNFFSLAPEFINAVFPDCQIVFLVRDGRACAHSLQSQYAPFSLDKLRTNSSSEMSFAVRHGEYYVPWWVEKDQRSEFLDATPFVRCIWMWQYMTNRCYDFATNLDGNRGNRVFTLRYEDLIQNSGENGKELIRFLGIPPNSKMDKALARIKWLGAEGYLLRPEEELLAAEKVANLALSRYGYLPHLYMGTSSGRESGHIKQLAVNQKTKSAG